MLPYFIWFWKFFYFVKGGLISENSFLFDIQKKLFLFSFYFSGFFFSKLFWPLSGLYDLCIVKEGFYNHQINILIKFCVCTFMATTFWTQIEQTSHCETVTVKIWVRCRSGYMSFWLCISWQFSNKLKRRSGHVDSIWI